MISPSRLRQTKVRRTQRFSGTDSGLLAAAESANTDPDMERERPLHLDNHLPTCTAIC